MKECAGDFVLYFEYQFLLNVWNVNIFTRKLNFYEDKIKRKNIYFFCPKIYTHTVNKFECAERRVILYLLFIVNGIFDRFP